MENNSIRGFETKIAEISNYFLGIIQGLTIEGFELDREFTEEDTPGFPIFTPKDTAFYRSKYQEGYLEWAFRRFFIQEAFNYLFRLYDIDVRWNKCIPGDRNEEHEQIAPVEFYIVKNGHAKAYRYTPIDRDYSIPQNIPHFEDVQLECTVLNIRKIDQWVVIDWSDNTPVKKDRYFPFQITITIKDLFLQYFSMEEYGIFINAAKKTMSQAYDMLGFQTIKSLISSNLSVFKTQLLKNITTTSFDEMQYLLVDSQGTLSANTYQHAIKDRDVAIINNNFFDKSRYLSLVGEKAFASSFITSEYLFHTFKPGQAFDYTAIITGYIKAVEQLCACIIYDVILPQNNPDLVFMSRQFTKQEQTVKEQLLKAGSLHNIHNYYYIVVSESNIQYYNQKLSLESLLFFFDVNKEYILDIDQNGSWPAIKHCIKNYIAFDRNGYFHKHNINDFSVVERIRNNTLLVIYWLLGSVKLTNDIEKDCQLLGIVDDAFDRLFKKIALRHKIYRFVFVSEDGTKHKMIRLLFLPKNRSQHVNKIEYDSNGYLNENVHLSFLEVEEYPDLQQYIQLLKKDFPTHQIVSISRKTMPKEIYIIEQNNTMIRIK